MEPLPTTTCPLCGLPNACAVVATGRLDAPCWCTSVVVDPLALARVPDAALGRACLCIRCATGQSPEAGP
ncbi:MAG TPA: cysteine-rich CWC family protein [Casimicrobiaceae bacterium]|jgi:hypothetical protein|nr:cysteine-rich CWC family protein [Casimicrobiaceae bacterium]